MIPGGLSSSRPGMPHRAHVSVPVIVLGLGLFPSVLALLLPSNLSTVQEPAQQVNSVPTENPAWGIGSEIQHIACSQ